MAQKMALSLTLATMIIKKKKKQSDAQPQKGECQLGIRGNNNSKLIKKIPKLFIQGKKRDASFKYICFSFKGLS